MHTTYKLTLLNSKINTSFEFAKLFVSPTNTHFSLPDVGLTIKDNNLQNQYHKFKSHGHNNYLIS